jgi:hypothetical protein
MCMHVYELAFTCAGMTVQAKPNMDGSSYVHGVHTGISMYMHVYICAHVWGRVRS